MEDRCRERYREVRAAQPGAPGLVADRVVIWNTIHMCAAANQLRTEDNVRLSPLGFEHVNMLGRDTLTLPDTVARDPS